jgi:hypothetical protein
VPFGDNEQGWLCPYQPASPSQAGVPGYLRCSLMLAWATAVPEAPVILGRADAQAVGATAGFVGGRGSRLAAACRPRAGAGALAA